MVRLLPRVRITRKRGNPDRQFVKSRLAYSYFLPTVV
jgi:hypothetical protein